MDRTAWIVVALCVVGLVVWEIYLVKQTPPRPAPVGVAPGQSSPTTPEQIVIRKKFFFEKSPENKDNYVIEMDVDLENRGDKPYQSGGYFVALGSAAPIHPKDYPSYTRLVWCIDGRAKGIDVGWFGSSSGFLGVGQRVARPYYQENIAGAEWVAVSNQFFTTLMAPLTGKA